MARINRMNTTVGAHNLIGLTAQAAKLCIALAHKTQEQDTLYTQRTPGYKEVRRETLLLMSSVLTLGPLAGKHELPGKGMVEANPMCFNPLLDKRCNDRSPLTLRTIGQHLHPDHYSPQPILDIIDGEEPLRPELLKILVYSSELIGYNFDLFPSSRIGIYFECYDGGKVFPEQKRGFKRIMSILAVLNCSPPEFQVTWPSYYVIIPNPNAQAPI